MSKSKHKSKRSPRRTDTIGPRPRVSSLAIHAMTEQARNSIPVVAIRPDPRPDQLFGWPWPRLIRVPFNVHPTRQAVIVGAEWIDKGEGRGHWLYFFRFCDGGEHWRVSEAECAAWQNEGNGQGEKS